MAFALAALAAAAAAGGSGEAQPRTFALALGEGASASPRLSGYDLVVVDGQETNAARVAALRGEGGARRVLGYLSIGSVESYRPWWPRVKRFGLEPLDNWPGERVADVSKAGLRDELVDRIAPSILAKGFDGLFLDNADVVETHPRLRAGMRSVVRGLRTKSTFLMAQNGGDEVRALWPLLDGWNREDVSRTYDFDRRRYVATDAGEHRTALRELRAARRAGLLATATDYVSGDAIGRRAGARATASACSVGALSYVADIGLRRVLASKPCPTRSSSTASSSATTP